MATMAEVAREAGVSVATVSRLLNNQGIVSPETAERVYAAIQKLSYEPNLLARNFRKSESRVILILALGLGFIVLFVAWIWAIYRVVKGWLALADNQPVDASKLI